VAADAAIALEFTLGIEDRHAAQADVANGAAARRAAQMEITEWTMRQLSLDERRPVDLVEAAPVHLGDALAEKIAREGGARRVRAVGHIDEAEFAIDLPEPVRGGFGEITQPPLFVILGCRRRMRGSFDLEIASCCHACSRSALPQSSPRQAGQSPDRSLGSSG